MGTILLDPQAQSFYLFSRQAEHPFLFFALSSLHCYNTSVESFQPKYA
jgi:hypothetical protein